MIPLLDTLIGLSSLTDAPFPRFAFATIFMLPLLQRRTKAVGGSAYSMSAGMPQANGTIAPEPCFSVEDAAKAVFSMAALPLGANVFNMTVMASQMPYVGRG